MSEIRSSFPGLTLALLGPLQITLGGKPIRGLSSDKERGLLAFLVMEAERPHRRSALAEMFWPNRPRGVARNNLKQALSNLRKVLGDRDVPSPYLIISRDRIQFNLVSQHVLDAREFLASLDTVIAHNHPQLGACKRCGDVLRRTVDTYRGDFLSELSLPDCQEFEEWSLLQREVLRRQMANALRLLLQFYEERDTFSEAIPFARRLVNLEPWNEGNHRSLIRLLALDGRRSEALRQYKSCLRILEEEFGVEPSEETKELLDQVQSGALTKGSTPLVQKPDVAFEPSTVETRPFLDRLQEVIQTIPRWLIPVSVLLAIALLTSTIINRSEVVPASATTTPESLAAAEDEVQPEATQPMSTQIPPNVAAENQEPTDDPRPASGSFAVDPSHEREVLEIFYHSTDGARWKRSDGWLSDAPHCEWYGVFCMAGAVTELNLGDNFLYGTIPPELSTLRNLVGIALHGNNLMGPIPPELGDLSLLTGLNIGFNDLTGPIPPELGQLSNLDWLGLEGNTNLRGEIPPELGNLTHLQHLMLSTYEGGTLLSGVIPSELSNLTRLTHLSLANSLISGPIPPELGNLTRLQFLDLSNMPLSGTLPSELGNLSNLTHFHVGEGPNQLSGSLPLSFMNLQKLRVLQYHQTDICEPSDPEFQAWLESIPELYRTGVLCTTDGE